MAKVIASITTSVDGYIAGPEDGPGKGLGEGGERLHYWSAGRRVTRQRVAELIREAADAATEPPAAEGLPPLPRATPHSRRRTYSSIVLRANNDDMRFVMGQVGLADSKMPPDVYAQREQRRGGDGRAAAIPLRGRAAMSSDAIVGPYR